MDTFFDEKMDSSTQNNTSAPITSNKISHSTYSYVDDENEYIVCRSGNRFRIYTIPLNEEPINVGKIKQFTGGDSFVTRNLYTD
jgi:hypothetical protein